MSWFKFAVEHGVDVRRVHADLARGYCEWPRQIRKGSNKNTGLEKHPEYSTWRSMVRRCHSPSHKAYPRYGGRGIEVFSVWRTSFRAFILYLDTNLGTRPPNFTLDRIDNNKGYEPGNLRWASHSDQQFNRRGSESKGYFKLGDRERELWCVRVFFKTEEEAAEAATLLLNNRGY